MALRIGRHVVVSLVVLAAATSCASNDPAAESPTSESELATPAMPAQTSTAQPSQAPPAATPPPATVAPDHSDGEATGTSDRFDSVASKIVGAEVLGTFGRREVHLAPFGAYGYVQPNSDEERCLEPILDAAPTCFDVSAGRFDLRPRWDPSGSRMVFASEASEDAVVVDARDGTHFAILPDDGREFLDWTTQVDPSWFGSGLVALSANRHLVHFGTDGRFRLSPGVLATEMPEQFLHYPPLDTGGGSLVVSAATDELAIISATQLTRYPFPDNLERASSRPGPSALRPPLLPIAMLADGTVFVADSLPATARQTGDWSATSGAWILDPLTGDYLPVFTNGIEQRTSVLAVGLSPQADQVLFVWADDRPAVPVMKVGRASLAELPIDPTEADLLVEALPGVAIGGSREFNPLAWTLDNQTAVRVDEEWVLLQLPERAAPAALDSSNDPVWRAAVTDYLYRSSASPEVRSCVALDSAALPVPPAPEAMNQSLDASLLRCGGDVTGQRQLASQIDGRLTADWTAAGQAADLLGRYEIGEATIAPAAECIDFHLAEAEAEEARVRESLPGHMSAEVTEQLMTELTDDAETIVSNALARCDAALQRVVLIAAVSRQNQPGYSLSCYQDFIENVDDAVLTRTFRSVAEPLAGLQGRLDEACS